MDHVVKSLKITKMLRNLKKYVFLKNVSKKSSGTNPILVKNMKICISFMKIHTILNKCVFLKNVSQKNYGTNPILVKISKFASNS